MIDELPVAIAVAVASAVVLGTGAALSSRAATQPALPQTRWSRPASRAATALLARPAMLRALRLAVLAGSAAASWAAVGATPPVRGAAVVVTLTAAAVAAGTAFLRLNPLLLLSIDQRDANAGAIGRVAVGVAAMAAGIAVVVDDGAWLVAAVILYAAVQCAIVVASRRSGDSRPLAQHDFASALLVIGGQFAPIGYRDGRLTWRNPVVHAAHADLPTAALHLVAVVAGLALTMLAEPAAGPSRLATYAAAALIAALLLRTGFIRPWFYGAATPLLAAYGLLAAGRWLAPLDIIVATGLHAAAMAVLHRQAISRHDPRTARAVQFPSRAVVLISIVATVTLASTS